MSRTRVRIRLAYGPADAPVTCLAMLLSTAGAHVTDEAVRSRLSSGRDGSSLEQLRAVASELAGADYAEIVTCAEKVTCAEIVTCEEAQARSAVCLVFLSSRQPVIVETWDEHHVSIVDPWSGRTTLERSALPPGTGALVITGTGSGHAQRRQRFIPRWLTDIVRGDRAGLWFVLVAGIALVAPGLLTPALIREFVDTQLDSPSSSTLTAIVLGLVAAAAVSGLLIWMQLIGLGRLTTATVLRSTSRSVWRILRMPAWFHAERDPSSIAFRVGLNEQLSDVLAGRLTVALLAQLTSVFFLLGIAVISPILALVALLGYALIAALLFPVARHRSEVRQRQARESSMLATQVGSTIRVLETLKATGSENVAFNRMYASVGMRQTLGNTHLWALFGMTPVLATGVTTAAVVGVGAVLVIDGAITAGSMTAALMLLGGMLAPLAALTAAVDSALLARGPMEQIGDILSQTPDSSFDEPRAPTAQPSRGSRLERSQVTGRRGSLAIDPWAGALDLQGVSYAFGQGRKLVDSLSLSLPAGSVTAIIGPSGSGKSTVGRLIAGLYHPTSGRILLDGKELTPSDRLRRAQNIGFVDQEVMLYQATVRANITLFDREIPDSAVVRAARDAHIDHDISRRPGAYDAAVEEDGLNFSGGQRQRLVIARSIVRSPRVLVLDEATSALDAHTEARILDSLRSRGCTVVIVAHRLSTIRNTDRIVVLDHGRIAEQGTHAELVDVDGLYSKLVSA